VDIDDQYNVLVLEGGEVQPVISGGEEDVVHLALRLSIAQMVSDRAGQPLSLLVLDEIFGSLDEGRRQHVVALLRGLGDRFPQVVLITHIESVRDAVDRVLRVALDPERGAAVVTDESGVQDVAA
jgi:exonuclease SbcC